MPQHVDIGGMMGIFGAMMGTVFLIGIAFYVYMALALMTIGGKNKYTKSMASLDTHS